MAKKAAKKKAGKKSVNRVVSLPADLNEEMQDWPDENWSKVAQRAFRVRLGEFSKLKQEKNMQDVIKRLRGIDIEQQDEAFQEARGLGSEWAKDDASASELRKLERFSGETNLDELIEASENSAYTALESLAFAIIGDDSSRSDATEFWERAVGEPANLNEPGFLKGFVHGALEVWQEVKRHI